LHLGLYWIVVAFFISIVDSESFGLFFEK
jgi:hypothetical protein